MEARKPKVLIVDGNIAAGKSSWIKTMLEELRKKDMKVCVVEEPVQLWEDIGILQKFYVDPQKYGYSFQTFVFITRIQVALKKYEEYGDDIDLYILERSWFTDRLFGELGYKNGNINDLEYRMYQEWCDFHQKIVPFQPSGFVYLRCSAETSHARCLSRARDGEDSIALEYLQDLLAAHDTFFTPQMNINGQTVPCLQIDTTENFLTNDTVKEKIYQQLLNFYHTLWHTIFNTF